MKDIAYHIADPTKNITALVGTEVDSPSRPFVASCIMENEPSCEQVGFVGKNASGYFLEMAGGEFCGNASMSAASLICASQGLMPGESKRIMLNVSGADEPVCVYVTAEDEKTFRCRVTMPPPVRIADTVLDTADGNTVLPAVFFGGITHIIAECDISKSDAQRLIKEWCAYLGADGLGIMLYDGKNGTLTPLVYIPTADTLFWESSCASGTAALGAYLSYKTGNAVDMTVKEPGGELGVCVDEHGVITLFGRVVIVEEKLLKIEL